MTDVAKAAGVSQSTVSFVLNNVAGARLSAATRAKVLAAAASLGYQLAGRDLRAMHALAGGERRHVIGYVVDELSTSPHPVVSIDGARDAAWAQGCLLQVAVTRNNTEQEAAVLAGLLATPFLLGIVYSTTFTRAVTMPDVLLRTPTVLLNCHDRARRLPSVVPAELAGGQAATQHLIAQGHKRIGFINGEPWMEAAQDRLKGYRRALAAANLPFDAALVHEGDWMSGSGYEATLSLLKARRPPTAIFCANDLMALGALEAIKQLGLRVPHDVSLMGYDDQEISRHTHPPLTTLVLPNYEMGAAAVGMLLQLASGGKQAAMPPRHKVKKIAGPLVLRDSVAAQRR